jgi:hypothetical protein
MLKSKIVEYPQVYKKSAHHQHNDDISNLTRTSVDLNASEMHANYRMNRTFDQWGFRAVR